MDMCRSPFRLLQAKRPTFAFMSGSEWPAGVFLARIMNDDGLVARADTDSVGFVRVCVSGGSATLTVPREAKASRGIVASVGQAIARQPSERFHRQPGPTLGAYGESRSRPWLRSERIASSSTVASPNASASTGSSE